MRGNAARRWRKGGGVKLRDYQQRAITQLYDWFRAGNDGNPCLVLPTGSGKSHIIAELCRDALQSWPETRILMLTSQRELIQQNAAKLRMHWRNAPLGIYSAGMGRRDAGEPITFAGIQSVRTKAAMLGHVDLILIDECHLVSHKDEGGYRTLITDLRAINPGLRVIGLTATPYRLGHGLITDKPAIFGALIEPVTIPELIEHGYLSMLRSKVTALTLDTKGVHKRGGEYIESELQAAVNTDDNNAAVVREIIERGQDRKAWLIFCAGVDHAQRIRDMLTDSGIVAECVTGKTPKRERDRMLADFMAGKIRALTNANVLTTGFDYPGIDLIAMLRPTMSAGLYVQMAGRGLRIAPNKDDCLVLDFAGNVATHGPIVNVEPPRAPETKGTGDAPVKVCDTCGELVHPSVRICPACLTPFPDPVKKKLRLHADDIMGIEGTDMPVKSWSWRVHTSRTSGRDMLRVTYYGAGLMGDAVDEYLPVCNPGYAGDKSMRLLATMARQSGATLAARDYDGDEYGWLCDVARAMDEAAPPAMIEHKRDGKFYRVVRREWDDQQSVA